MVHFTVKARRRNAGDETAVAKRRRRNVPAAKGPCGETAGGETTQRRNSRR